MIKNKDKQNPIIYLVPNLLGSDNTDLLPLETVKIIRNLKYFIAERAKSIRAYLGLLNVDVHQVKIFELNKHRKRPNFKKLFEPAFNDENMGIISEAGCPAIADPGSQLIKFAHENSLKVKPLVGPSSIILALMGSGLNGQNFKFNGYLPKDKNKRKNEINRLENESRKYNLTQIFIETPYRNQWVFKDLIKLCSNDTRIALAIDLTLKDELILMDSKENWQKGSKPQLKDKQVVFLIQA